MIETTLAETVRRVEEAPLSDLVAVSVDDVQAQLDSYQDDPEMDSTSLYRRWEKQQWAVQDLDFSADVQQWSLLAEADREVVRRTMTLFFIGEQAVTDTLSPILHAAPFEDERIFLATQIADEARHAVFFQRFFDEVLEVHGGLRAALASVGSEATAGFRRIFETHLAEATDRVRLEPQNRVAWAEAVITYHIVIEGYLALGGQRSLLRFFRAAGLMPGFTAGFTAVARDESRHVGYGVLALRRRLQEDPELARPMTLKLLELADPAVQTVVNPDNQLNGPSPDTLAPQMRQSPLELRRFSLDQMVKRMRLIGLSEKTVAEVRAAYDSLYEGNWARYEALHGVDHPVRWYQRELATA
ncbi:MAG: ribonucleotide-diphosphate reductase subunit beta [Candidatus Dormibacteraeota bacterium]|nr:ribonucleotide-diphosphate reductase subunit beta [Candidatus Dormibacteraeota bacterium]